MRYIIFAAADQRFLRWDDQGVRDALSTLDTDDYSVYKLPDHDLVNGENVTHQFR